MASHTGEHNTMKSVIVLCFLATFAIAVPVYEENVFKSTLSSHPVSTKREKKSALPDITPGLSSEHGIEKSQKTGQGTSVAAKSFRRPIIIKRKLGYHIYRDSDEEMAYAEPGEKCREQVKFKLCDHEPASSSKNRINSPTFKCINSYKTDNEMENSIKMAKKAVDYLQKDLKRMENFSPKMANPQIEDIESNNGLHHDIEIAREALEHIEQNFESVNSEVNNLNELQIPKSKDVERLTRWREAIENIHKNFEIVKNIEDTFKTDNHFSFFRSNNKKAGESGKPVNTEDHLYVPNKFAYDNLENNEEAFNGDQILKSASNRIAQIIPNTEIINDLGKHVGDDMFISPTENRAKTVQLHSDSLKSEINYKDASIRSDASEIESTLSDVPKNHEEEKTTNDNIRNDHELLPKVSGNSYDFLHENVQIEEQKIFDKSEPMTKAAVPEMLNANQLIKMQLEKEILENNRDHVKSSNNNENEELTIKIENNPLERQSSVPKSTFIDTSENSGASGEKNINSDKTNNKNEDNENEFKSYENNMRLNNNQLEKTDQMSNINFYDKGQDVIQSSHLFSWKEKNVFGDEGQIPNDQQFRREEASMKSSESRNEKSQLDKYQEEPKLASTTLEIENNSDDIKAKFYKSVPELKSYAVELSLLDKEDRTDNQQSHTEEASMRSSESQNEKTQSNKNKGLHELPPMGLDIERHPEERTWPFSKSVPELPYDPTLTTTISEKVDITDDQLATNEEAGMRSSEIENNKSQLSGYQEDPAQASSRLDIVNNSDDTKAQLFKSVHELQPYPVESLPLDKGDITNDQLSQREDLKMRSSDNQYEKVQSSENQKVHELRAEMRSDNERYPEEHTWAFSKSVPELTYDPMLSTIISKKVDITGDQHANHEEAGMRSSDNQNEELQISEYQEEPKQASTRIDSENNYDDTRTQIFKSVPELQPYPVELLSIDKGVTIDDQQSHKEEPSMRTSDSQNEKTQSKENLAVHELLPMGLGIERHPEARTWPFSKSVPELPYDPTLSTTISEKIDSTDNQHAHNEEAGMRSSENQNEKSPISEYQEERKKALTKLDIENSSDDKTAQYLKSVPEFQPYPVKSLSIDKGDTTDDQQSHKEEPSMRLSETQNEKSQINEYQEEPKQASTRLENENNYDDTKTQIFKSVPELHPYPVELFSIDKGDTTDDQQSHKEAASMRSSESQYEKMQSRENHEEVHELLPMGLGVERHPEEPTWPFSKSVPELPYDPMLITISEKVGITDNQHALNEEAGMRSSETQNEKSQLSEYQEDPKKASTGLVFENNSDDSKAPFFKSIPELQTYQVESLPLATGITADDHQQSHKEEASLRSAETQNEKSEINEYQEEPRQASTRLDSENNYDDTRTQIFKSVPEVQPYPVELLSIDKGVATDDQQSHKEETSMRTSDSQNEKTQSKENLGLVFENNSDDSKAPFFKSVTELLTYPVESLPLDDGVTNDDRHTHTEEASMRSSETENEKSHINEYQEERNQASTGVDIENNSDATKAQFLKSVPELQPYPVESLSLDKGVTNDDEQSHKEEVSMRSSETQNEKLQISEYQEEPKPASMKLDFENSSEKRAQILKSVPEFQPHPVESLPLDKGVTNDNEQSHKEEASIRSSETRKEKSHINEYQEERNQASTGLDIENNSDATKAQFLKSVPELQPYPVESLSLDKGVTNDDEQSHKEEVSMRSSETQNEKSQISEYQEEPKPAAMKLVFENSSEKRVQILKSVPEFQPYPVESLPMDLGVTNDDEQSHKEEASMRSSETGNEKSHINEYQEERNQASTGLDIENNSDATKAQLLKSVPELQPYPVESLSLDKGVTNDDEQSHKEEVSMRSSETQNQKSQISEYQEERKQASTRLDIENSSEKRAQFLKSVPEFQPYPVESLPLDKAVTNDDEQSHKEEVSMRSPETQNEKSQINEYPEERNQASTGSDIENNFDDTKAQFFKSVPELQPYSKELLPLDKGETTNDQHKEEASMRSSESQHEKMQSKENQEVLELLPMELGIERYPEERTWPFSKSVPELPLDPTLTTLSEKVDITKEQHVQNEEADMRSSETQNEKLQLSEYQEEPKQASSKLDIENSSGDKKATLFKSVPELQPYLVESLPLDKGVTNDDQQSEKEEASMRLSDIPNEHLQLNKNQEAHEPLMIRLDMTKHPEDRKWPFSKSASELSYDPMESMPSERVEKTNEVNFLKERNMRLSQHQNEGSPFDEYYGLNEFWPTKLEHARLSQTQNERQQIYFNHNFYEPHSSRLDIKKTLEDESSAPNKLRFNYIQNPIKEQTVMRLSQNENENKETQYPSTSLGLSNDMLGEDNTAHIMNDFMHLSVGQPQQLHENPMLRSSNERQHLNYNFKSLPEYKTSPQTSQFEYNDGQNNEHISMRINQEQSEPEPLENQNIHNSLSMRWNTENQQDRSPNTFKSNLDFGNDQFIPHEASKTLNTLEYRTRPQLFDEHTLDDTHSNRWYPTVQHNDHFENYYKTIPEAQVEYTDPIRNHLHRVAVNHRFNDGDTFTSHDFSSPSSRARLHDHMQKYHQEKSSNIDSSIEPSMHMTMRDPFAKSGTEFNNMYFNYPHGTARFSKGLPIAGVNPGAMGMFPTGNVGGCGIPLLLSCTPSVVSGSLARPNIAGPLFKSEDENYKYYIKRDAKNIADVPDIKVHKPSSPHSHGKEETSEI